MSTSNAQLLTHVVLATCSSSISPDSDPPNVRLTYIPTLTELGCFSNFHSVKKKSKSPLKKKASETTNYFQANPSPATSVSFGVGKSSRSRYVIVADGGGCASVWDVKRWKKARSFRFPATSSGDEDVGGTIDDDITGNTGKTGKKAFGKMKASLDPTDTYVAAISGLPSKNGEVVKLFRLREGGVAMTLCDRTGENEEKGRGAAICFRFSIIHPSSIAVGFENGSVLVWNLPVKNNEKENDMEKTNLNSIRSNKNNSNMLESPTVMSFHHASQTSDVGFSPTSASLLASCSTDGTVVFHDKDTSQKIQILRVCDVVENVLGRNGEGCGGVMCLAFHSDGMTFAVGTEEGIVVIYDLKRAELGPTMVVDLRERGQSLALGSRIRKAVENNDKNASSSFAPTPVTAIDFAPVMKEKILDGAASMSTSNAAVSVAELERNEQDDTKKTDVGSIHDIQAKSLLSPLVGGGIVRDLFPGSSGKIGVSFGGVEEIRKSSMLTASNEVLSPSSVASASNEQSVDARNTPAPLQRTVKATPFKRMPFNELDTKASISNNTVPPSPDRKTTPTTLAHSSAISKEIFAQVTAISTHLRRTATPAPSKWASYSFSDDESDTDNKGNSRVSISPTITQSPSNVATKIAKLETVTPNYSAVDKPTTTREIGVSFGIVEDIRSTQAQSSDDKEHNRNKDVKPVATTTQSIPHASHMLSHNMTDASSTLTPLKVTTFADYVPENESRDKRETTEKSVKTHPVPIDNSQSSDYENGINDNIIKVRLNQVVRDAIQDELQDLREDLHDSILNFHSDMIRQFQRQSEENSNLVSSMNNILTKINSENVALKEENRRIRRGEFSLSVTPSQGLEKNNFTGGVTIDSELRNEGNIGN